MMNKKRKHLRSYVTVLFCVCICITVLLDDLVNFFMGMLAGFNGVDYEYAKANFEGVSRIAGWIALAVIILIFVFFYLRIRQKVALPIERLANSMREVSQGNLEVRVPVDGEFEFGQMEESFNYMVEELDKAKHSREIQEQKNQQLYAGIAHDLKTPMTMIMGYAKVLESGNEVSEEDKNRYVKTIIEQTLHANALLDSLLAYSKLENQSYQLKKEKKDIAEYLRTCVADYYPILEEAEIQLELSIPNFPVEFCFDELEMKRVFTNLLSNMVKHNPKKTACIIQLEEGIVSQDGEDIIRIVVADDGPKIAENLKEVLFDTFAVGDSSRNTKNGSGLGLSISKKIVERHDGKIYYTDTWEDGYKAFIIEMRVF